jgi:hypothetical protein
MANLHLTDAGLLAYQDNAIHYDAIHLVTLQNGQAQVAFLKDGNVLAVMNVNGRFRLGQTIRLEDTVGRLNVFRDESQDH